MRTGSLAILGGVFLSEFFLMTLASAQGLSGSASDPASSAEYFAQVAQNNKNMVMSVGPVGMGGAVSGGGILAGMFFSAIGLGAFIYGKKNAMWRPMVLGIALMVFPYFPLGPVAIYLVGAALTAVLFFWRE